MARPYSLSQKAEMVRLYREGQPLRAVARAVGASHEIVRQAVLSAGFRLRPRASVHRPMSALAQEVFDDLDDHFLGAASIAQLVEWLGSTAAEVTAAGRELADAGWVVETPEGLEVVQDPKSTRYEDFTDRDEMIAARRARGMTAAAISHDLGLTIGTVAGVLARQKRLAA